MKSLSSSPAFALTLVSLALCAPGWLLGSDSAAPGPGNDRFANWYGRAGGPVGADAIDAINRSASPAPASAQVQWFGRAGGPAGTDAVEALSRVTPAPDAFPKNAFDGWFGRAGGPVGVSSVPAQGPAASSAADAQKRDYVWEISGPSVRSVATGDCVRVPISVANTTSGPCGSTETSAKRPAKRETAQQPPAAKSPEGKSALAETAPQREPAAADVAPAPRAQPEAANPPPPAAEAKSARAETAPEPAREPTPAVIAPVPPTPKPVERMVEPAPQRASAPLHVTLDAETHFGFNKYRLKPSGQTKVDQLLAELAQRPFDAIVVTGHTDRIGSKAYNEKLSERRALSVKGYLAKKGVDAKKIQTQGAGAAEPVTSPGACEDLDSAKTIECLAPDRRVELAVIGVRQR